MKRYIAFILAVIVLLSVSACKSKPADYDEGYLPAPETEQSEDKAVPSAEITELGKAIYPDMPKHYNLTEDVYSPDSEDNYFEYTSKISELETDKSGNSEFVSKTLPQLLKDNNGKNFVYSPSTLYFSLSLLSECVGGNTQSEILDLLGKDSTESVRNNSHNLWQKLYVDDGLSKSVSANSIWLRSDIEYNQQTIDTLKNNHYASSFSGDFENDKYTQKLRDWINEQTGSLLKESVQKEKFDSDTAMALVTATYFKSAWKSEFLPSDTAEATFHGADGDGVCDFMHQTLGSDYYWTDKFSAVKNHLNVGYMSFILPDEDETIDDLLCDTEFLELVTGNFNNINSKSAKINMSIPKFDITADLELIENLKSLGINDAFSEESADFSPLTTEVSLYLNKVSHATRVKIDEEGCEAASYVMTSGIISTGVPILEEVDFVLDRPFIFVVSGEDNLPRFIGVVNNP